jgi:hypothetical protein
MSNIIFLDHLCQIKPIKPLFEYINLSGITSPVIKFKLAKDRFDIISVDEWPKLAIKREREFDSHSRMARVRRQKATGISTSL